MKHDLSPSALAELQVGSQMDHNARHERHTRMLQQSVSSGWMGLLVISAVIAIGAVAWAWYLAGPPPFFNPFNR